MKRIKHLALAAVITLALTSNALAGNIPTGIASTIPTGVAGNMPTGITFSEHVVLLIAVMIG